MHFYIQQKGLGIKNTVSQTYLTNFQYSYSIFMTEFSKVSLYRHCSINDDIRRHQKSDTHPSFQRFPRRDSIAHVSQYS